MDRTALLTFKTVAETASVTRAAAVLCCVPSAVTARLQALERSVGTPLFLRERKGMIPTARGRILLRYAERAEQLFAEAEQAVCRDEVPTGTLRVGATDTAATVYLPRVFSRYHQAHPDVDLQVTSEVTEALISAVKAHRLDCAIVNRAVADRQLKVEKVRRERLVLASALSVADPFALPEITYLAARAGGAQRARIAEWWAQSEHPPIRVVDMPSIGLRLSCAAAGMGITAVPLSVLAQAANRDTVRHHAIPEPWCWLETYLVWRADDPSFAARRRFREVLRSEFETDGAGT